MKIKALIAFVMFTGVLFGQTTTYTGTVKDLSGAVVTSGNVTFTLTPSVDTTISGTSRFSPLTVNCTINGSGALVANDGVSACVVTQNTVLTPTGTSYTICIQPYFTSPGSCFVDYAVTSSKDISTVAPTPQLSPQYPVYGALTSSTQSITGLWSLSNVASLSVNKMVRDCRQDGVVADGTTDDGGHINTCLSNAVSGGYGGIKLPAGSIHVATAINATNLKGLTILGAGTDVFSHAANANITELMCDTGTVCLDTAGSTSMHFENFAMRLANTYATPSTVAVIEGRTASNSGTCYSENNSWKRVNIWTDQNGTFNGTRGYFGIYNVGGEVRQYDDMYIMANNPMILATSNVYTVTSPYETLGTSCPASMTAVVINGGTFENNRGHGIISWTTADVKINDTVFLSTAGNAANFFDIFAFNGTYATNWDVRAHVESLQTQNSLISIATTTFDKNSFVINVGGSVSDTAAYIAFDAAGHTVGSNYFAFDTHNEAGNQRPFMSNAAAETINGGEFHLSGTKSPLSASNVTLNGTRVYASGFTDGNVTFNAGSQYTLFSDSGVSFRQTARAVGALQLGASDTGLSRGAAAQVNVGNGTAGDASGILNASAYKVNGVMWQTVNAPTIGSGFGTSPVITANGTAVISILVGTGGTASTGTLTFPAAVHGWACSVNNLTAAAANRADNTVQTGGTTTSMVVQNQTKSTGAALAWSANDFLLMNCGAY